MTETDRNPFVGLRTFGFDQHRLFFGRQTQIDELLLRLDANHMLAITGPAGSGKSSLVRAGLMPRLLNGEDGDSWKSRCSDGSASGRIRTKSSPSSPAATHHAGRCCSFCWFAPLRCTSQKAILLSSAPTSDRQGTQRSGHHEEELHRRRFPGSIQLCRITLLPDRMTRPA